MPTDPVETVLNRDLSRVAVIERIESANKLLTELVNEGTRVFKRCESEASCVADDALLLLFIHIVEMADGVQVLVDRSCIAPAIPLVRSEYEADLAIQYILESDTAQRGLAWLLWDAYRRIEVNERFDGTTTVGAAYQAAWASDTEAVPLDFPRLAPFAATAVAKMRAYIAHPDFAPVDAERTRLRAGKGRFPPWYGAFGGPPNLRELAKRLKSEGQYMTLYGQWSEVSHAHGPERFRRRDASADPTTRLLRDSSQFSEVVGFAASFLIRAIRLMLGKFRPSEDIGPWYLRDVRPHFVPEEFAPPNIPPHP